MKNFIELVKRSFEIVSSLSDQKEFTNRHKSAQSRDPIPIAFSDEELLTQLKKSTERFNALNEELMDPSADPTKSIYEFKALIFNIRGMTIGSILTCMGKFEEAHDLGVAMGKFNENLLTKIPQKSHKTFFPFKELFGLLSTTAQIRQAAFESMNHPSNLALSDRLEDLGYQLENQKAKQIKVELKTQEDVKAKAPVRTQFAKDATSAEVAYAFFCSQKPHLQERAKYILKELSKANALDAKKVYIQELNATYSKEFQSKQHPGWEPFLKSILIEPYVGAGFQSASASDRKMGM